MLRWLQSPQAAAYHIILGGCMTIRRYLNVLTWVQVHNDVLQLTESITQSDYEPNVIVGIGYGGIIPATLLYFALPEVKFRIAYPKASNHGLIEPLSDVSGKKVLLADDLAITGDSLMEIRDEVLREGASQVRTACLYASAHYDGLDYCTRTLEQGELVVFPWYTEQNNTSLKVFEYKNRFGKHEPME